MNNNWVPQVVMLYGLVLACLILATSAYGDTSSSLNLSLPGSVQNYQSDRFKAGELDCSNAIGSATQLEYGVSGIINQGNNYNESDGVLKDVGVFARITIPLGKRVKSRIDCNRLYELELRKKELEVMKLEEEINRLREMQFEN
jgi:hypothetical protein